MEFCFENGRYVKLRNGNACLCRIISKCNRFIVPSFAFSPDGQRYKIIKASLDGPWINYDYDHDEYNCFNEEDTSVEKETDSNHNEIVCVREISFDESSEIEEIKMSFILCSQLNFFLPPKIKRINFDLAKSGKLPIIHLSTNNRFISIRKDGSIMIHYPLELLNQFFSHSHLHIRETVRFVGNNSFFANNKITTVVFPSSVSYIGKFAFYGCSYLKKVRFKGKSSLEKIGISSFAETALSSFEFPPSVEVIKNGAFKYCRELFSFSFPLDSKLKIIDSEAFESSNITFIDFPTSVEHINDCAFCYCKRITSISFTEDSKLRIIGRYAFSDAIRLVSVLIPSSVEEINSYAFNECSNLSSVMFAEGSKLKIIGESSFRRTKIESISFPSSLNLIGPYAFWSCKKIRSINLESVHKLKIEEYAFGSCCNLLFVALNLDISNVIISHKAFEESPLVKIATHK